MSELFCRRVQIFRLAVVAMIVAGLGGCAASIPPQQQPGLGGPIQRPDTIQDYSYRNHSQLRPRGRPLLMRNQIIRVREGDTLLGLAKLYGVPVSLLMRENGLTDLNVYPGMRLVIPNM